MSRIIPRTFAAGLAALLVASLFASRPPDGADVKQTDSDAGASVEIIVQIDSHLEVLSDDALSSALGGEVSERVAELDSVLLQIDGETVADAIERVGDIDGVTLAEPNHHIAAAFLPDDPLYANHSAPLEQIGAPLAWDLQTGDPSVMVAVLDSGIDLDHPDLLGAVWTNRAEVAGDGIDNDGNGCIDDVNGCAFVSSTTDDVCPGPTGSGDLADDNGHGTFVAGIIAARANNGAGISGVAPGATIVPVKILDCHGSGTALDAAKGLLYAGRAGARVANLSFSMDGYSTTLANAIRQAHNTYDMVIVTATGNTGGAAVRFPAIMAETISVASAGMPGEPDVRSAFSDWGAQVTVAAPGLLIAGTVPGEYCTLRWLCIGDGPYAVASGTSFAAPFVAGLAALIVSETPGLSADAVRALIVSTAQPLPDGDTPGWAGYGRIDMGLALSTQRTLFGTPASDIN